MLRIYHNIDEKLKNFIIIIRVLIIKAKSKKHLQTTTMVRKINFNLITIKQRKLTPPPQIQINNIYMLLDPPRSLFYVW
jgi:hypothetical protein